MNFTHAPYFLLRTSDNIQGESGIEVAAVRLQDTSIETMLQRLRLAAGLQDEDQRLTSLSFVDDDIHYFSLPEDFWDRDEQDPLVLAYDHIETEGHPPVVSGSLFDRKNMRLLAGTQHVHVPNRAIGWTGSFLHSSTRVESSVLFTPDILVAYLYTAQDEQISERFALLAEESPRRALKILEDGLHLIGDSAYPRQISHLLSQESLLPLLKHPDKEIRQQGIIMTRMLSRDLKESPGALQDGLVAAGRKRSKR